MSIEHLHTESQHLFPDYEKIKTVEKVRRNLKTTLKDIALVQSVEKKLEEIQTLFQDPLNLLEVHRNIRHLVRIREAFLKKVRSFISRGYCLRDGVYSLQPRTFPQSVFTKHMQHNIHSQHMHIGTQVEAEAVQQMVPVMRIFEPVVGQTKRLKDMMATQLAKFLTLSKVHSADCRWWDD